jgi:hypothetical protein
LAFFKQIEEVIPRVEAREDREPPVQISQNFAWNTMVGEPPIEADHPTSNSETMEMYLHWSMGSALDLPSSDASDNQPILYRYREVGCELVCRGKNSNFMALSQKFNAKIMHLLCAGLVTRQVTVDN